MTIAAGCSAAPCAIRAALQTIDNPQQRLRHEIFWPDFGEAQLAAVIDTYRRRHTAAPPERAQAV